MKVNPESIEGFLNSQDVVVDAAAFKFETENHGEILGIAIVLVDESRLNYIENKVKTFLSVPMYKIFRVMEIPRNENGKIDRIELMKIVSK